MYNHFHDVEVKRELFNRTTFDHVVRAWNRRYLFILFKSDDGHHFCRYDDTKNRKSIDIRKINWFTI